MARIIRPDSPARARSRLVAETRAVLADLEAAADLDDRRDRLAYACVALHELDRSTERTAEAWERRGYWLKADQFRREWSWAGKGAQAIHAPLLEDDLEAALAAASALMGRMPVEASARPPRDSGRWTGAFARLKSGQRAPWDR